MENDTSTAQDANWSADTVALNDSGEVRRFQRTYASAATSRQERSIKTTSSKTTSTSRSFNSIEDETNQSSDSTRPPSPDFIRKGKTPASPLSTFGSSATSDFSFVTTKPTQVRSSITTYFEESKTSGNSEVDNSAIIESRKHTTDNMVRNNPNPAREISPTKSADVTSRSVAYQAHLKDLPVLQKEVPVSPPPSSVGSSMNSDSSYASVKQSNVRSSATIYEQSKSSSNVTNKQFSNPSAVKQNKFSSNLDKVKYSTDKNKLIIDARHLIRQTPVEDKVPKNVGFVTSVASTYEEHVKELQANPGVVTDASYVAIRPNKVPSIIEYFERTKTSRDYPLASVGQLGKGREPTLDYSALNEANRLSRSSSNLVTNETKRISRSSSNLASNESKRISRSSSNLERNVSTNFLRSTSDLEMNNQKYRGWENEDYYEKRKFWRSLSNEGRESSSEVRNVRFNDAKVSRSSSNLAINEKTSRSRNLTSNESNRVSRSSSNEAKRFSRSSSNLAINESKVSRSSSNLALNESKRLSHSASTEQSKQSRNSEVRNVTFNISNKYLENLSHNERHVEDIYAVSTKPVTRRVSNKYVEKTKSKFEDKGANTKSVNYAVYGAKNKFEDSSVSSKNISSKKRFEGSSFSTDSIYHADDYTDYGSKTQLIDSSVSTKTKIVDHSSSARFADSTQFVGSAASKHLTYKEHLDETPSRPTPALRSSSSSIYYTSSSSVPMILPRIVRSTDSGMDNLGFSSQELEDNHSGSTRVEGSTTPPTPTHHAHNGAPTSPPPLPPGSTDATDYSFVSIKLPTNGIHTSDHKATSLNHSYEVSAETKRPPEAVNLELVNIKAGGGFGVPNKKTDSRLDLASNPYEEYFIPVNHHKKFFGRGEKLTLTKDKRDLGSSKSRCRWILALVLVIFAIIAALILAGILSSSQEPIPSSTSGSTYISSVGGLGAPSGGGGGVGGSGGGGVPGGGGDGLGGPGAGGVPLPFMALPRAVKGELTIDNMEFTEGLSDPNSAEFKDLATSLETEIKNAVFDPQTLNYGASNIAVKVKEFAPEFSDGADSPSRITRSARSVVVKYLIGWVFKDGIVNPQDPITPETLNERMESYVRTHNNFLYNYRLPLHKIKSELVLDQCRVNNGHCNHVCQFDYRDLKFECLCPPNFSLDESGHACQPINGDHTHFGGDHTHHGALPEPSSTDHAYPLDPLIDPTAEPGHHGQGLHPLQPLVDPTAEPYPTAEPTAEPGHHGQGLHPLQPLVDPTAEPYPTAEPEPTSTKLNLLNPVEPFLAIDPTALPEVSGGNSRQNSIDPFSANNPTALPEVSANSRHNSIDPTAESNPEDITYETPLQPIPSGDLDVIPTLIPVPGRKEGRNGNLGKLLDFGMFPPLKPIPEDETPFVSVPVTFVPVPVTERVPYVETPPPVRPTVGDTLIGHLADFGMMEDRGKAAFGDTSLQMCAEGLFQCSRNTSYDELVCIPSIARCNGIPDCPGSSDEFGCEENQCHGNFQCGSKRCLAYNHVCNGVPDCEDLSDENEAMCNSRSCDVSSQFHCGSGHCIPLNWRCNGKVGCGNTADEHGCHYTCSKNEFQCPEGRCIPLSFRCNGAPDCTHGEDEQACECPETKFKCESGGCIDYSYVCDGRSHCPDHSDEWSCVNLANDGVHIRRGNQWLPLCNKDKSWTDTYSDVLCQKLGYSKSQKNPRYGDLTDRMDNITDGITRLGDLITDRPHINLTYLSDDPDSFIGTDGVTSLNRNSYVTINPLVSPDIITSHNLFNYLNIYSEEGAGCDDVVQIQCQEFSCGTHIGDDSKSWSSIGSVFHTKSRKSCTASIISPKWLLTSYHCIYDLDKDLSPDSWLVFAGKDSSTPQNRHVKRLISHPATQFSQFHYRQDLMLVELTTTLLLDEYINPTCLSDDTESVGTNCQIVGWTKNRNGIALSEPVTAVSAPIVDKAECNSKQHYVGKLDSSDVCAGSMQDTLDTCMLEGGGPLMCLNNGKWELKGILNHQSICKTGFGHHPSVFTSVPLNKKWIEKVMGTRPNTIGGPIEPTTPSVAVNQPEFNPIGKVNVELNPLGTIDAGLNQLGKIGGDLNPLGVINATLNPLGNLDNVTNPLGVIDAALNPLGTLGGNLNPLGKIEGELNPLGVVDAALNVTNPLGVIDATLNPLGKLDNVTNPLGVIDAALNPFGKLDNVSNPLGKIEGELNPLGVVDAALNVTNPLGVIDNALNPFGKADNVSNPLDSVNPTLNPLGVIDAALNPFGKVDTTSNPTDNVNPTLNPLGKIEGELNPLGVIDAALNPFGKTDTTNPSGDVNPTLNPLGKVEAELNPLGAIDAALNPFGKVDTTPNPTGKVGDTTQPLSKVEQVLNPLGVIGAALNTLGKVEGELNPSSKADTTVSPVNTVANSLNPVSNIAATLNPFVKVEAEVNPGGNSNYNSRNTDTTVNPFGKAEVEIGPLGKVKAEINPLNPFSQAAAKVNPFNRIGSGFNPFGKLVSEQEEGSSNDDTELNVSEGDNSEGNGPHGEVPQETTSEGPTEVTSKATELTSASPEATSEDTTPEVSEAVKTFETSTSDVSLSTSDEPTIQPENVSEGKPLEEAKPVETLTAIPELEEKKLDSQTPELDGVTTVEMKTPEVEGNTLGEIKTEEPVVEEKVEVKPTEDTVTPEEVKSPETEAKLVEEIKTPAEGEEKTPEQITEGTIAPEIKSDEVEQKTPEETVTPAVEERTPEVEVKSPEMEAKMVEEIKTTEQSATPEMEAKIVEESRKSEEPVVEEKVAEEIKATEDTVTSEEVKTPEMEAKLVEEIKTPEMEEKMVEGVTTAEKIKTPEPAIAPEEIKTPEEAIAPEDVKTPEQPIAPEETKTPDQAVAPEETKTPEQAVAPGDVKTPEEAVAPEEVKSPEQAIAPEEIKTSEESIAPEDIKTSEQAIAPEEIITPETEAKLVEEVKTPDAITAEDVKSAEMEAKLAEEIPTSVEAKSPETEEIKTSEPEVAKALEDTKPVEELKESPSSDVSPSSEVPNAVVEPENASPAVDSEPAKGIDVSPGQESPTSESLIPSSQDSSVSPAQESSVSPAQESSVAPGVEDGTPDPKPVEELRVDPSEAPKEAESASETLRPTIEPSLTEQINQWVDNDEELKSEAAISSENGLTTSNENNSLTGDVSEVSEAVQDPSNTETPASDSKEALSQLLNPDDGTSLSEGPLVPGTPESSV